VEKIIMSEIETVGADWLANEIADLTDTITHVGPVDFNEANRYLSEAVTSIPGYIRFDVNPFMREIIDCADVNSPVREVNLKKGVQITYTTLLESIMLYFMCHVKTVPMMFVTADKELAKARIENNIIPMINQSGFGDIIRSSDEGNTHKTGKTANHLQWEGGGYMIPNGAKTADKMRMFSIMVMLKDELDTWADTVGKDGDPDALTDDRCSAYWERRKIFRGSTPLILASSKIQAAYLRGDQRQYNVLCKSCGFPQSLRWETIDKKTGIVGGFMWDYDEGTILNLESVRYCCQNCGHEHYEYDKELLFSPDGGAYWHPTAKPVEPNIRSYHLPAMYSPIGMQPWYKCVSAYLKGFDPIEKKVRDYGKYQVFYNNVLAEPFEIRGSKVNFVQVSAHRRAVYRLGQIPNTYAAKYSGSVILFLTCLVDVHKNNLAVAVMGWTREMRCYVIDYWRFEVTSDEDDCSELTSPVWGRLRTLIEETEFVADDGKKYRILLTLIDAGYANDTVTTFCSAYASGVIPILGRDRAGKNQSIKEFATYETQAGTIGYKIIVDHYKDRLAAVLRREWIEESGEQPTYHFNTPVDITDKQLKELTVESRREKKDPLTNVTTYFWYRPGNARNELWDLLGYGHASVEILAYMICIEHFEIKTIDWLQFWDYIEKGELYYSK
jgi:phage terminase large subunit GpA-like protein